MELDDIDNTVSTVTPDLTENVHDASEEKDIKTEVHDKIDDAIEGRINEEEYDSSDIDISSEEESNGSDR